MSAATAGRDLRAEVVRAEWLRWAESIGWAGDEAFLAEAFAAGMDAQAALAAPLIVAAAEVTP